MPTFEVECQSCHDLKWPTLPERPRTYLCILCQSKGGRPRKRGKMAGTKKQGARIRPQTAS